jgi:methionine-rich copper-binding protein CopC
MLLSVLLLFGLALILNVNTAAATDHTTPKVTATDPGNNAIIPTSKTVKVTFKESIQAGNKWIELKNSHGTMLSTTYKFSDKSLNIVPKNALAKGVKYNVVLHSNSVKDLAGNGVSLYKTSFTVSSLTSAQVKDGLARTQKFYNTNHRLPNFVSFGSSKVPISAFQKIIASQGLKIKVVTSGIVPGRPVYITSDNINNKCTDTTRINSIVNGLRTLGINAYNMGLGPNTHITALQSGQVPKNALVVDIYGGADAGLIYEMGSSWYKSIKGAKNVFTVYWPPSKVITGLSYLVRAHDDNYDPASFKGLAHPDQYMLNLGYNYLYSGCITSIVNAIQSQATH